MIISEQFITFEINNRFFAFEAKNVIEIFVNKTINPIPIAPDYVVGIINFRGEIVSVIDISVKFDLKENKQTENKYIIVTTLFDDNKHLKLACLCDNVHRIETINFAEIQQVPSFGTYFNPDFLKGVFYLNQELYTIINIEKVFKSNVEFAIEKIIE